MYSLTTLLMAACLAAPVAEVDFDREVVPLLTRNGCNSGACHGAAAGRGGLQLSLLGLNPAADYEQLVREWEGRRINLARPDESLLLQKATEQLEHGGGTRFYADSAEATRLLRWIEAGARRQVGSPLAHLEIDPPEVDVDTPGQSFELGATARFEDGSVRDVTHLIQVFAEDASALGIESHVQVTVLRPGQHTLVVRYMNQVVPVRVRMPWPGAPVSLASAPRLNYIDDYILGTLEALRIPLSEQADDTVFARRVWLDLTGSLPPTNELNAFLESRASDKRAQLIDQLLRDAAFVDFWTLKFAQQFRVESGALQVEGAAAFHAWLRNAVAANRPYDEIVRAMLLAQGDSYEVGPANFVRAAGGPRELGEFVSESMLGIRLRCANCHDHPLDRWTQDDYHGLAAIFARVTQSRVVELAPLGEVTHPRTGEAARPRIPGGAEIPGAADVREQLADWISDPQHRMLSRALVNRVWKDLMGRGLVEPVDDLRATNPASHPELLDRLAEDFIADGYDLRQLIRRIIISAAYARSARSLSGNSFDDRFYSHALPRPLLAEVLADAIADVTGVPSQYGDLPRGTRAVTLFDARIPSDGLDTLGRCPRTGGCLVAASGDGELSRTLQLTNGPLLNEKLRDPEGRVPQMLKQDFSDEQILDQLYQRALSRLPTNAEREYWTSLGAQAESRDAFWEDFLWALLNCREFQTNH